MFCCSYKLNLRMGGHSSHSILQQLHTYKYMYTNYYRIEILTSSRKNFDTLSHSASFRDLHILNSSVDSSWNVSAMLVLIASTFMACCFDTLMSCKKANWPLGRWTFLKGLINKNNFNDYYSLNYMFIFGLVETLRLKYHLENTNAVEALWTSQFCLLAMSSGPSAAKIHDEFFLLMKSTGKPRLICTFQMSRPEQNSWT